MKNAVMVREDFMGRVFVLVLAAIVLITCGGCFWEVEKGHVEIDRERNWERNYEGFGDRGRSGFGEPDRRY